MFSRRIRTTAVAIVSALGLSMALSACGADNSDYAIYKTAKANGFTQIGAVDFAGPMQKVSAQVGECPVVLALLERRHVEKYSVTFNGRLGNMISNRVLTPEGGAGALPSASEIANTLNYGAIAKQRGVTDPKKVPGSRFGVCDPYKLATPAKSN
jgi:hypothetical protein